MALFWMAGSWFVGLATSSVLSLAPFQWAALIGISLFGLVLSFSGPIRRLVFYLLLAYFVAGWRAEAFRRSVQPGSLSTYNDLGRTLQLRGLIVDFPERRAFDSQWTVQVEAIRAGSGDWHPVAGKALVQAEPTTDWTYGDRVEIMGRLETPPDFQDFSYRAYLGREGIHSLVRRASGVRLSTGGGHLLLRPIYSLRRSLHSDILRVFPEPEASLMSGILLGLERGISQETRDAFNRTGTTHIIAISGFNISIIAAIFIRYFGRWLGARNGAYAAAFGIALYTVLVGAQAAVVRAALMAGVALLANQLGRSSDGFASLGAAGIVMTGFDPNAMQDVGFQLSFASTLGLVLYTERFTAAAESFLTQYLGLAGEAVKRIIGPLSEYGLMTLAAQIMTLPLILLHFGRLSVISPFANLLILPAQPAVMIVGGLATLGAAIWLPLGRLLAPLAWPFPAYTIAVVERLARLPWAQKSVLDFGPWHLAASYAVILGITLIPQPAAESQPRRALPAVPVTLVLIAMAALCFSSWRSAFALPDGRLHVILLDVGPTPGVLIETPTGRRLLLDGGGSVIRLGQSLDSRLSPFDRALDWIILGNEEPERIGAIAGLVDRYQAGGALVLEAAQSPALAELADHMARLGRPVVPAQAYAWLDLGDGARLEFIELDQAGMAIWITYGNARFLLAPSAQRGWVEKLPPTIRAGGLSALVLPDGGDVAITPPGAIQRLQPIAVLLPLAASESASTASLALTQNLAGFSLIRSDHSGWIELVTDSQRLWAFVERAPADNRGD